MCKKMKAMNNGLFQTTLNVWHNDATMVPTKYLMIVKYIYPINALNI